jgi:signal transduction histidine kinase
MKATSSSTHAARTRLALTYLGIIMALTLTFSAVTYQQSINEARGNLIRQEQGLRSFLYFTRPDDIRRINDTQLAVFRRGLLKRLAVLNLGMLALGGGVSYVLARRSLRPLEETIEAQSRFTSDAAHELRTPLAAMKLENELGLRDKKLKITEAREIIASNLEEIAKLQSLTDALLRLARSSDGAVDASHWQNYKLQDVLASATSRLEDKAKARQTKLHLVPTNAVIHGDPDQLIELFVPIIANAIKYSPIKSEVRIRAKTSDNKVFVDITDEGVGIAEIDLPHIFDRFYRADQSRSKTKVDGYGLGLSLARAIADSHGGKIRVKSRVGHGSTFTVELPLVRNV